MTRSFKKTPISGNTGNRSEKRAKRFANRSWRLAVKDAIRRGGWETLPMQKEVSNVWDFPKDGKHWFGTIGRFWGSSDRESVRKWMRK